MQTWLRRVAAFVTVAFVAFSAFAQTRLGNAGLHPFRGQSISSTRFHIGGGAGGIRFVARIGGVSFIQTAHPLTPADASVDTLAYNATKDDGERFTLKMSDGSSRTIQAYDWQLIPTARYADDSKNTNCVTAFGSLASEEEEKFVRANRGFVINYHPQLVDSLVGLRLFQADFVPFIEQTSDLPTDASGRYLLGRGETTPNVSTNNVNWTSLQELMKTTMATAGSYVSYVLTDRDADLSFNTSGGSLKIDGQPTYVFWRYKISDDDLEDVRDKEMAAIVARSEKDRDRGRAWMVQRLTTLERQLANLTGRPVTKSLAALGWFQLFRAVLDAKTTLAMYESGTEEVPMLSSTVSRSPALKGSNPAVYDTVERTMRYAAFFRYMKRVRPQQWKQFLVSIAAVKVAPVVQTPTAITFPAPSEDEAAAP